MKPILSVLTVLTAAALSVGGLKADTINLVTSSSALSGSDTLNWGSATNGGPCQQNVAAPLTDTSTGGLTVTASPASGSTFDITQQKTSDTSSNGCSFDGWKGNFNAGDNLLWTDGGSSGPVTLKFGQAIAGVGFQIQAGGAYGDFTAQIQAYDSMGNLLAGSTYTENGDSEATYDNSAIFLGLLDTTGADISSIAISLTAAPGATPELGNFAINQLSLVETPEPSGVGITLGLVLGMVALAHRRKKMLQGCGE